MKPNPRYCVVLLLCCFCSCYDAVKAAWPVVDTTSGRIQGKYTDKAQVFKSVPYAAAPIKELRWKAPQRPRPWPGILTTVDDPPGCPQLEPCVLPLPQYLCPKKVSEDCLYLNVFAPLNATATSKLPVMVFVHGGNFIRGYSGGLLYDGQYIANTTGTVVVTVNYRLGALGFLVYGSSITGNYAIKDQRLALEWIQDNIANFGGNPGLVTFWGQSAGAVSAAVHMTTARSSGLFHRVIMESDPFSIKLKDPKHAKYLGEDFAKELGCGRDDVNCLYSKNASEIVKAQEAVMTKIIDLFHLFELFLQWAPTVDGLELTDQPMTLFVKGEVAPVPLIIGTTSQETVFFIYEAMTTPMSRAEYDLLELVFFPLHFEKVHKQYPTPDNNDTRPEVAVIGTDYTFTCGTRHALRGFTSRVNAPAWLYVFNHSFSIASWGTNFTFCDGHSSIEKNLQYFCTAVSWGTNFTFCDGHSCHGAELPFVFHATSLPQFNHTQDELVLSNTMVGYWTNFAHYGNPNQFQLRKTANLLSWPEYSTAYQSQAMRFRTPKSEVISNYLGEKCDFWDSIGYFE